MLQASSVSYPGFGDLGQFMESGFVDLGHHSQASTAASISLADLPSGHHSRSTTSQSVYLADHPVGQHSRKSTAQSVHLADFYSYDAPLQESRASTAQSLDLADSLDEAAILTYPPMESEVPFPGFCEPVPSSSTPPSSVQSQANANITMGSVKFLVSCIPVHYNEAMINAELNNNSTFTCPYELELPQRKNKVSNPGYCFVELATSDASSFYRAWIGRRFSMFPSDNNRKRCRPLVIKLANSRDDTENSADTMAQTHEPASSMVAF